MCLIIQFEFVSICSIFLVESLNQLTNYQKFTKLLQINIFFNVRFQGRRCMLRYVNYFMYIVIFYISHLLGISHASGHYKFCAFLRLLHTTLLYPVFFLAFHVHLLAATLKSFENFSDRKHNQIAVSNDVFLVLMITKHSYVYLLMSALRNFIHFCDCCTYRFLHSMIMMVCCL